MKKFTQNDLKTIFKQSLAQVSKILGVGADKISRDLFRDTCYSKGIKYINPYLIGGYVKYRDELIANGELEVGDVEKEGEGTVSDTMELYLYQYVKEHKFIPSLREYRRTYGYNVGKYYDDMESFYEATKAHYSDIDEYVFNESFYTEEYRQELAKQIEKHKKFIITSAVCGKDVDENFFNSLKNYAKRIKALVLVLPIVNNNKASLRNWDLDPKLKEFKVLFEEVSLNENLRLWDIRINSKQTMSLTGLDRVVAPLDASIIVGSTKQAIKYIPTSKMRVPHMLASTGCCTVNDYTTLGLMPNRATKIAEVMHKLGALVVEIENHKIYHCRNIEAGPNGEIIDLSTLYKPDGNVEKVQNVAMVVGDLHVPKHDEDLINKHLKLIPKLNVSAVVLHDTINMSPVSHHNVGKRCLKALQALKGENTIMGEAFALKEVLNRFCTAVKNVVLPYSNHPDHLNRYLEEARFVDDYANFYLSLDLAKAYMDDKNVLQYLMEEKAGVENKNIQWLDQDDTCSIYGVECGCHGSEKVNGCMSNPITFGKAFGKNITAHKHSPSLTENSYVVGIACEKDQGYNSGLSSWLATSALLYPNSTVQLINFIKVDDEYKCGLEK